MSRSWSRTVIKLVKSCTLMTLLRVGALAVAFSSLSLTALPIPSTTIFVCVPPDTTFFSSVACSCNHDNSLSVYIVLSYFELVTALNRADSAFASWTTRRKINTPINRFVNRKISFGTYYTVSWLGGVTVRASDLRSSGRGFDYQSGRYQAIYLGQLSLASLRCR